MSFLALSHKLSKICKEIRETIFAMPMLMACYSPPLPPTCFAALYKPLELGFTSPNSDCLNLRHFTSQTYIPALGEEKSFCRLSRDFSHQLLQRAVS